MNISSKSTKANEIIQKIPVARTPITDNMFNVSTQEVSTLTSEMDTAETSSVNIISTIALHTMNTSRTTEDLKIASSSQRVNESVVDLVTVAKPDIVNTVEVPTSPQTLIDLNDKCPQLHTITNLDSLTQDEFLTKLTDSCRYDRLVRPPTTNPLSLYFQIDLRHVESYDHLVSMCDCFGKVIFHSKVLYWKLKRMIQTLITVKPFVFSQNCTVQYKHRK